MHDEGDDDDSTGGGGGGGKDCSAYELVLAAVQSLLFEPLP